MKVWMYKTLAQIRAEITVRGRPENFVSQSDSGGAGSIAGVGSNGGGGSKERESLKGVESSGSKKNRA